MSVTPVKPDRTHAQIRWEPLPADYQLPDDPVENTAQPLLAGGLRESLELANWIRPEMLVVSNFGLCATVDEQIVVKATTAEGAISGVFAIARHRSRSHLNLVSPVNNQFFPWQNR